MVEALRVNCNPQGAFHLVIHKTAAVCDVPTGVTDETVCAFVFPNGDEESCNGRSYYQESFPSVEAALAASTDSISVLLIHQGACGVCSNAQDLAGRVETIDVISVSYVHLPMSWM